MSWSCGRALSWMPFLRVGIGIGASLGREHFRRLRYGVKVGIE